MTANISLGMISNEATRLAQSRLQSVRSSGNVISIERPSTLANPEPAKACEPKNSSLLAFTSMLEATARERGRPHLGLEMAASRQAQDEGVLTDLFRYAPTLRHALNDVAHYFPIIQTRTTIQLDQRDGLAQFSYGIKSPSAAPSLQDSAYTLGRVYLSLLRELGESLSLRRVTMAFSAPSSTQAYQAFFKASVSFGATRSALWFPAPLLQVPLRGANIQRYEKARNRFEALMPSREDPAVLEDALRAWLLQSSHRWDARLEHAAGEFGITPRTLQRRLKDQGVCFMDLRARVRMESAQRLLADSGRSVTSISEQLGFSEISAFTRAFRSHTQQSPRAFRQAASATS